LAWLANKSLGQARGWDAGLVLSFWRTALATHTALKSKAGRGTRNVASASENDLHGHHPVTLKRPVKAGINILLPIKQFHHFSVD
jgi:hypothetical protein